ncbi:hypothetical protein M2139_000685 [Enterococcus sp. PF1-24]|uniref:DUF1836 domain-containing protein n=1 Tax=unclassified Enterococcus TaxID=2608891 RepID=UPI002476557B|nr:MULTISPECIES: DUF1836 domain-containing protein [unclassified Enterococcus]MDH6363568.1 hypothetical protein [Enterococcus sp. PFB1-1]MDH6400803.1 hypothetical protein [Enterococcus sp. PF1-24]
MKEELQKWGNEIENFHLPRWEDLPDIELYMDQVLTLVEKYLEKGMITSEDNHSCLTKAMVNNYVKTQMIPPPVKKRYNRTHLAFLIAITLLKQVLTIAEIREGILFQGKVDGIRNAYNLFCKEQENALHLVATYAKGEKVDIFNETSSPHYLAVKSATISFASKLLTQKMICLEIDYMKEEGKKDE